MTAVTSRAGPADRARSSWRPGGIVLALGLCCPLALLLSWPKIVLVWQTGWFYDTDDAMRMVEVRDWLAGQGWFDLSAHRLDPPAGVFMHWSRVVDVPLGLLMRLFGLFAGPDSAERLTRIVFPLALQAGLIAAMAWASRTFAGPKAMLPGALLVLMAGISYVQFQPGRVDHHAPQILLLTLMAGTTALTLDPAQFRKAALTALLAGISLAISLENLPFIAIILATLPIAWAVRGAAYRPALLWLAAGLMVFPPLLFLATVGPQRYTIGSCDSFSIAHLTALGGGVAGLLGLAAATPLLSRPIWRWAALAVVGVAGLTLVGLSFPACLHDPYANLDPILRTFWLAHVTEAQPLLVAIRERPDTFPTVICPMLAAALAILVAVWRTRGLARARWIMLAALVGVGFAGTWWEIRVSTSTQPLAMLGGGAAVAAALDVVRRHRSALWAVLPVGLFASFSSIAWALAPLAETPAGTLAGFAESQACRDPATLAPLNGLPVGLAFAPIDTGSHLLAGTRLSVIGAPYHRNQHGNRLVIEGFMAPPETAEGLVRASGARYVLFCPGEDHIRIMTQAAPLGLAARLLAGDVPAWLEPLDLPGTRFRVYAVK